MTDSRTRMFARFNRYRKRREMLRRMRILIKEMGNMTTLKEKLQKLCLDDFHGRVRILFCNPKVGILRTEWFYLYAVPLSNFIDYLDCNVAGENLFDRGAEEPEIQITVAV